MYLRGGDNTQGYFSYTTLRQRISRPRPQPHIFDFAHQPINKKFSIDSKATYILQIINGNPAPVREQPGIRPHHAPQLTTPRPADFQTFDTFGSGTTATGGPSRLHLQSPICMTNNTYSPRIRKGDRFAAFEIPYHAPAKRPRLRHLDRTSYEIPGKIPQVPCL